MKKLLYILLLLSIVGCVSKSDYEQLKSEKKELIQDKKKLEESLSSIQREYNQLFNEIKNRELEKNQKLFISEKQALKFIEDNYKFYEKSFMYRDIQLRRIADNSFQVSLDICSRDHTFVGREFWPWQSVVKTLTIKNDGTYEF